MLNPAAFGRSSPARKPQLARFWSLPRPLSSNTPTSGAAGRSSLFEPASRPDPATASDHRFLQWVGNRNFT